MPTRKSAASAASPEEGGKEDGLSIEDLNLPKSIVQRLAKGVLPPNSMIQKDAVTAMCKSATVFVNYITSQAAEHAARQGKKTVMPKDIFDAMTDLEFEAFLPRLEAEVTKFTSIQADKRNSYRKKVREEKKAAKEGGDTAGRAVNGHTADGESPPAKRVRRLSGGASASAAEEDDEADMDEATEGVMDEEDEEGEDDEVEEEDVPEEGLTEDLLEEKENGPSEDDVEDVDMSD